MNLPVRASEMDGDGTFYFLAAYSFCLFFMVSNRTLYLLLSERIRNCTIPFRSPSNVFTKCVVTVCVATISLLGL